MARSISLHDARAFFVALILLLSGTAFAQTPTPKAPATPEPPKAKLNEEEIRAIEKQIEESTKKLEAARQAAEQSIDSVQASLDSLDISISNSSDERVEIGGSVQIEKDEVITGDVVAVGGNVDVYGKVMGDAVAVGGRVRVHEGGMIMGDGVAVGSRVQVDDGGQIMGERVSVAIGLPGLNFGVKKDFDEFGHKPHFFGFIAKLVWIASMLLLSLLFFSIAGKRIDVISRRVEMQPGQSFLVGLLGVFATPFAIAITAVLLVVTIIGIFLLPVLVLLIILMFSGGFLGVALAVGRRIVALRSGQYGFGELRTNLGEVARSPYMVLLIGFLALHGLVILGMLLGLIPGIPILPGLFKGFGVFTLIFATFLGYGALLLSRFGTRAELESPFGGPPIPPVPPMPSMPPSPPEPPSSPLTSVPPEGPPAPSTPYP